MYMNDEIIDEAIEDVKTIFANDHSGHDFIEGKCVQDADSHWQKQS